MVIALSLLLTGANSARLDPAQSLYRSSQRRIAQSRATLVVAGDQTYRIMGRRYRLDSPNLTIVCNGTMIYRKDATKPATWQKAPAEWPDDMWIRGFEKLIKGPYPPQCTGLTTTKFAGKRALSVDTRYSESPMFSSNMFFDPKTKLPLGYRAYSYGNLDQEVVYKKVVLNAPLKASEFLLPKD